ncbi:glycoside hydrolase superfamily, partial [Mycena epipterygia]
FGVFSSVAAPGTGLPGRFGVDYAFINISTVDIFVDQEKINFFRVTFLMERMYPLAFGLGIKFNETYLEEYADAVNYITLVNGAYALIDLHNIMRYDDPSMQPFTVSVIGNASDPTAATTRQFEEFWNELALRFVHNPNVVFGINNEPYAMPTELLLKDDQAAINGIRAAGAHQLILAPGNGFMRGHSWTQFTGGAAGDALSSEFMNRLVDPIRNAAIDVHEFIDDLVQYMTANDEWIVWSIWAASPLWGTNSPCCGPDTGSLEPGDLNDLGEPKYVAYTVLGHTFSTVWATSIRPTSRKRSEISSLN